MSLVDSVVDGRDLYVRYFSGGLMDVSTHQIGGKTFLYVMSETDPAVTVFEVADTGTLSIATEFRLPGSYFQSLEVASFNGTDYLIALDYIEGVFYVYSVDASGLPTIISSYDAFADYGARNTYFAEIIEIEGVNYIISHGAGDNSVGIFTIDDAGVISRLNMVRDVPALDGVNDVTYASVDGRHFILAAVTGASRVTAIEIGGTGDVLVGTDADDKIIGLRGDDDLDGQGGHDLMVGGQGDDVLFGRKGNDDLDGGDGADTLFGGAGNDTLDGGAGGDILTGGFGVDYISYKTSSVAVSVNLTTGTGHGGDAEGDLIKLVEGITASDFADMVTGDDGRNFIHGGRGDDVVDGRNGDDRIMGGGGADTLLGGLGNDTIFGAGGSDVINGGGGDDQLNGGGGPDVFVFVTGDGIDHVSGFTNGADRIDFSGHDSFVDLASVLALTSDVAGSAVIVDGAQSITLDGIAKSDLDLSDFIFLI